MSNIPMRRAPLVSNAGNRPYTPRFTAAVMVKEINCQNPGRSSPADYAVGYLLHSIPGLEAKFSEHGQPQTKVICTYQNPKRNGQQNVPGRAGKTLPDLAIMKQGNNQIRRHTMWQTIIFENARLEDRDPTGQGLPSIKATYLSVGPTAQERGIIAYQDGQVSKEKDTLFYPALVMPRTQGNTGRAYQKIALAAPNSAVSLANEDELRAAIQQRLQETPMGYPGFILVSRQLAPANYSPADALNFARDPSTRDASIVLLPPVPVDAAGRRVEANSNEQVANYAPSSIEDGLAMMRPEHRARTLWHQGWQHSLIPLMGFPQSLFAYDKAFDAANHYRFDEAGYGFADSVVSITYARNGSGAWVSNFQKPINSCGDIVAPEEFVTPDMPEYHRIAALEMTRGNTAERLQKAAEAAAQKWSQNANQRQGVPAPQQSYINQAPPAPQSNSSYPYGYQPHPQSHGVPVRQAGPLPQQQPQRQQQSQPQRQNHAPHQHQAGGYEQGPPQGWNQRAPQDDIQVDW